MCTDVHVLLALIFFAENRKKIPIVCSFNSFIFTKLFIRCSTIKSHFSQPKNRKFTGKIKGWENDMMWLNNFCGKPESHSWSIVSACPVTFPLHKIFRRRSHWHQFTCTGLCFQKINKILNALIISLIVELMTPSRFGKLHLFVM